MLVHSKQRLILLSKCVVVEKGHVSDDNFKTDFSRDQRSAFALVVNNYVFLLQIIFLCYFHGYFAETISHKITEVRLNRHHIRYFAEQYDYREYENVTCVFCFRIFCFSYVTCVAMVILL